MSGPWSRAYDRSSGMPLLVVLLVVTFAVAADLAHEAWTTAQAQQRTTERAARDFVRYAATSAADESQATLALALRALFGQVNPMEGRASSAPAPDALVEAAARIATCRCAPLFPVQYAFRVSLGTGELLTSSDTTIAPEEQEWLRDTVAAQARARSPRDGEGGVVLLYHEGPHPVLAAYTTRIVFRRDTLLYGAIASIDRLGATVFEPVARRHVHAGVTAQPAAVYDSLASVFLIAPNGRRVLDANPRPVEQRVTMLPRAGHESYLPGVAPVDPVVFLADTVPLGPEYGNLALEVSLASSGPATLSAEGVPRSRLFVLLGLLVLMGGLVAAAVFQIRREHELARLRADLTAGVSHELRTPLAQIMLYGETLMLDRTRSERERRAAAEVIVREARRLMHLVDNALHFARADRRVLVLTPEAIDVAALTRDILVSFAPLAWAAQVTLCEQLDGECPAVIDAAAYRQIVLNLLENAVRYGPTGQTITVSVGLGDGVVRLGVADQGPGIEIADRERIWAPFVRLRASRQGPLGTGIGLAVVRDLTMRHGGRAWVERADSGGARFVVELPRVRPRATNDTGRTLHASRSPSARSRRTATHDR